MFFKEAIVILSFMYCFWQNTPTYVYSECSIKIMHKKFGFNIWAHILIQWYKTASGCDPVVAFVHS